MRGCVVVLAVVALVTGWSHPPAQAQPGATVISENWLIPNREVDIQVHSADTRAPVKSVRLLLPPGWTPSSTRTWPTLWLLHGGLDDYRGWTAHSDIAAATADRAAIVVMPDTSWCSAYSDWITGPRWETYLIDDVDPLLRADFHAGVRRAVAGYSMGGLGAMYLAEHNRGFFTAAASFSGQLDPLRLNPVLDPGGPDQPGLGCGANPVDVWGPTGSAGWYQHDPAYHADHLAGLRLFFSVGVRNGCAGTDPVEQSMCGETQTMLAALAEHNIADIWHPVFGGGHNWVNWAASLDAALPLLLDTLGA
jgi:S-formylglutathione hydrolase FrmB